MKPLSSSPETGAPELRSGDDRLLDVGEVAEWLNVGVGWVREQTRSGRMPHVRLGRSVRYERQQVRQWISEQRRGGRR